MKKAALFIAFLVISCQEDREYNVVEIEKRYSLELPADMVRADHLNDSASLQYQNARKAFYVIVLDESKKDFKKLMLANTAMNANLDGYTDLVKTSLENTISYPKFSEVQKTKIDGLKARLFSVSGIVDDFSIYYEFACIEGKKGYYRIALWTEKNRKDAAVEKMKRIIASFKEIKQRG